MYTPPVPRPSEPLNYLELIGSTFAHYRDYTDFDAIVGRYGWRLKDVTDHPLYQQMNAMDPLPESFSRRHYSFLDDRFGQGSIEIVFHDTELVNVRSQQHFQKGLFRAVKAKKFLIRVLVPFMEQAFGEPTKHTSGTFWFSTSGICGMAGLIPGYSAVTVSLIDERYK